MATIYSLHPDNPQQRYIQEICHALKNGAIMLYPTDTVYAIGCDLNVKSAVERVRQIKQLSNDKPLTFLCSSLSNISEYAVVSDHAYKIMRRVIPGPYTFLLPATKLVPKVVMNPKRKTTGIRVPDHVICHTILETLENPIISSSAHLPDQEGDFPTKGLETARLFDDLDHIVDLIIEDGSAPGSEVSTIVDFTADQPDIVRQGLGWPELQQWL
ncbi:MAG: threonylcarbamoyl-AMP synthase [Microcystis sp. M04BS1]|jgi:tRNA threonylcarbamoyl adenosine modification protein (Sua5/YciO/YrdC/YwlC family)|nr:threonylcarbamoyl-AMP synthase [Microcystis sp. M04BS1]NCS26740.1 threonylcarbamoyl-AMP synthase [Microcystis aeruginosa BS13-02]